MTFLAGGGRDCADNADYAKLHRRHGRCIRLGDIEQRPRRRSSFRLRSRAGCDSPLAAPARLLHT